MIQESAANFRITPARRHGQFTPAESAHADTFDNWVVDATADNGLEKGDTAAVTVNYTVTNPSAPQESATAALYKDGAQVGASKATQTWGGGANAWTATVEFTVDEGGFYTVRTTYGADAKLIGDVEVAVVDDAADALWEGHEIVPTQEAADAYGNYVFDETSTAVDFGVEDVLNVKGEAIAADDYEVVYYKSANGTWDAGDEELDGAPTKAGTYLLAAWPSEDYIAGVTTPLVIPFQIVAAEKSYQLFEVNPDDGTDVSDTEFVYNGEDFLAAADNVINNIGVAVDGKAYRLGTSSATTSDGVDYKLAATPASVTDAGEYTLTIQTNEASPKTVATAKMNVLPFDVSQAAVTVAAQKAGSDNLSGVSLTYKGVTFDGVKFANTGKSTADVSGIAAGDLELKVTSYDAAVSAGAPAGYDGWFGYAGAYGVEVSAAKAADGTYEGKNFTMSGEAAQATASILASDAAEHNDFKYDGKGFSNYGSTSAALFIDKSKGQAFDPELISWNADKTEYDGKNATVSYYDAQTGEAVSSLDATGTYKVVVNVDPGVKFDQGGTGTMYVKVANGKGATVYMSFDGKPVSSGSTVRVTEDGEAFPVEVTVKSTDGKVLAEGTDYEVEVRDTDANVAVEEIVDFGNYTVTVKPTGYDFASASFSVVVSQGSFEGFEIEQQAFGYDGAEYELPSDVADAASYYVVGIPYTGSAAELTVLAYNTKTVDGKDVKVYTELDPAMYELAVTDSEGEKSEAVKADKYDVALKTTEAFEAKYTDVSVKTAEFEVVDAMKAFMDVHATDWYADESTKAAQMGYMQGLGDTKMLMGASNITRADMAIVLMRMAGGNPDMGQNETYPTPFSDVEADAYYAKAIDWAYKAGVVQGYEGSFRPNDFVSREELATMVARFAEKAMGQDVSGSADLSAYADGAAVSEFAKASMAWCVEAGIFGVGTDVLNPQGTAQRAEVAAISVRLMPAEEL